MAKKAKADRRPIALECTVCHNVLRPTEKNTKNTVERLTISKYCPKCRQHTEHKEKKN